MASGVYEKTAEHKRKLSEAHKGMKKPWTSKYWKGRKRSEETKQKISKALKGDERISGKNQWRWKGGISKNKAYRDWQKNLWHKRKKRATGSHTFGEWENLKAQYNWICPCCGMREPEIQLTEDHIIPLSRSGSDNIENIQPLCRSCNCKKHTKIIKY